MPIYIVKSLVRAQLADSKQAAITTAIGLAVGSRLLVTDRDQVPGIAGSNRRRGRAGGR
jgi:hypothetical protein